MNLAHTARWGLASGVLHDQNDEKTGSGDPERARTHRATRRGTARLERTPSHKREEGGESEDERDRYGIAIRLWPAVATDTSRHRRLIPSQRLRRLSLLPDEQMLRMSRTTMHQCHGAAKITDDQTLTYAVAIGRRDREMKMRMEMLLHASWRRSRLWPTFPRFD